MVNLDVWDIQLLIWIVVAIWLLYGEEVAAPASASPSAAILPPDGRGPDRGEHLRRGLDVHGAAAGRGGAVGFVVRTGCRSG